MNPYIHSVISSLVGKPAFIRPGFITEGVTVSGKKEVTSWGNFAAELQALAKVDVPTHIAQMQLRRDELCKAYGFAGSDPGKPFAFSGGAAIIPMHGMLLNRLPYSFSFATGYNYITAQLAAAMADPDVKLNIFDVNTNGGTVAGCQECSDAIFAANKANGGKPSIAIVDSNCYSAGYYLASACDSISVTPSGGIGSIGVVWMHMDVSKALEKFGVDVTFITGGAHKVDGNMFEPLSEEVTSDVQAMIDKMYGNFTSTVGRNRGDRLTQQQAADTEARCYLADDGLAIGLCDAVQSVPDALNSVFTEADQDEDQDIMATENTHTQQQVEAASATAAADARKAERARISGIMGHAEAQGRQKLATHLANDTDMTVEQAAGVLAASAKETAPVTTPAAKTEEEPNHFKNAMNNGKQPNAGTGQGGEEGGEPTKAQRILGAYSKASGHKVGEKK